MVGDDELVEGLVVASQHLLDRDQLWLAAAGLSVNVVVCMEGQTGCGLSVSITDAIWVSSITG